MVLRIKKQLFKDVNDFVINDEKIHAIIVKYTKSFGIYNKKGMQIGQIDFKELEGKIMIAESGALTIKRRGDNYSIDGVFIDYAPIPNKKAIRQNKSSYLIYGKPIEYKYDIYERLPGDKEAKIAAKIVDDINDKDFYKITIVGGGNILKLLAISLAIAKLNCDPLSDY